MGVTAEMRQQIHAAVSAIAARCDGASTDDGVGFSSVHTHFGKAVAALPPEALDAETLATCYEMLATYKGQLSDYGFDYDALPKPPGVGGRTSTHELRAVLTDGERAEVRFGYDEALIARVRRLPGAHWDGKAWWVNDTPALQELAGECGFTVTQVSRPKQTSLLSSGTVKVEGDEVVVRFAGYRPEWVQAVKAIPGRRFEPSDKSWRMPLGMGKAVRHLAERFELDVDAALAEAEKAPPIAFELTADRVWVSSPYSTEIIAAMHRLGAQWSHRKWAVPIEAAHALERELDQLGFGGWLDLAACDELIATRQTNLEASRLLEADLPEIPGLAIELFPFQRGGVAFALKNRRCFIADSVGLGKTMQALATLEAADAFPAIVVCPASLKLNWQRECNRALPDRHVVVVSGTRPQPFGLLVPDVVIVNYDVASSWVETLVAMQPRGIVVDESHLVKEPSAQRTQAVIAMAQGVDPDGIRLCLSATPVLNQRREYAAQLRVLGRLNEFGGTKAIERMHDVNERLRGAGAFVRRTKDQVLTELPPVLWSHVPVETDPAVMVEYRKAERELLNYLAERAAKLAAEEGLDPLTAAMDARVRASSAEHLVRIGVLKQLAAKAKLPAAKRWVQEFLASDPDEKLLLFAHHVAVLDSVQAAFGCEAVRGGQSNAERMAVVDRFQDDDAVRLLALGLNAGGVGLTLTAAETVVFVEQGWTPAIHDQAVGRLYGRLNDVHGANAVVLLAADTIDERIAKLIADKRVEVDNATDGTEDDPASGDSILADLVVDLTRQAMQL